MKNVIITSTNMRDIDFVINDWYKSIKRNVNLENIDVVVIGFNLTKEKIDIAKEKGLIIYEIHNSDINVIIDRFIYSLEFLKNTEYKNVMFCDGGDLLFLDDISLFLNTSKKEIEVVREYYYNNYFYSLINEKNFTKENALIFKKLLKNKRVINAGVIVGNSNNIIHLFEELLSYVKKKKFGPDQIILNYLLYRDGFKEIEENYNYILSAARENYFKSKNKIKILHNAGGKNFFRLIRNFGIDNKNSINKIQYYIVRIFFILSSLNKRLK